ncbi:MAG: thioredoxin domain-containing protein [Nitrospinae bacterium]|nr:thioredoxin domain-containing protein [Nitrospinota bacterium]
MAYINSAKRFDVDITSDPYYGNKDARLIIIEFSDFECPFCKRSALDVKRVLSGYRDRIKLVFKNFPLHTECNNAIKADVHPNACKLAKMGECAFRQDRFWVMHDLIFNRQEEIKKKGLDSEILNSFVEDAGLDNDLFNKCMSDDSTSLSIKEDTVWGNRLNISSTPTFIINGVMFSGSFKPSVLRRIIEIELKRGT